MRLLKKLTYGNKYLNVRHMFCFTNISYHRFPLGAIKYFSHELPLQKIDVSTIATLRLLVPYRDLT